MFHRHHRRWRVEAFGMHDDPHSHNHHHRGPWRRGRGPGHHGGGPGPGPHRHHGGPFGGRRPMRFLARRLNLSDDQFRKVAAILSSLRVARQQAAVDRQRAMAHYATAMEADALDPAALDAAQAQQAAAAKAQHEAMAEALAGLHALLDDEQRAELSLLLREAPPWM